MKNSPINTSCTLGDDINMTYDALEGFEDLAEYHERHSNPSLLILTQHSPQIAQEAARLLRPDIENKNAIEIGVGVGFLAIAMAKYAKSVIAFEVDPCLVVDIYQIAIQT